MATSVVFVHGIRTSATMWRSQINYLRQRNHPTFAVDLPGHGTRMDETFTLDGAFATIDRAVERASANGPVLLVGHSMGGLVSVAYAGSASAPPLAGLVAASCTAIPRGASLATYRTLAGLFNRLPDRGMWLSSQVLAATLPTDTRVDFGAGGYALDAQDATLRSLAELDIVSSLRRLTMPTWFVNGQFDQLRVNERLFQRLVPDAELVVVPRSSHLVTAMRPAVFNAVLAVALATIAESSPSLS